jgi:hypothetical protein
MEFKYKCKQCGCTEFISQLNQYDLFISENSKIIFQTSLSTDEKISLYCRNCSNQLEYVTDDLLY